MIVSEVEISTELTKLNYKVNVADTVVFDETNVVFCRVVAVTPVNVAVQVSIISPVANLEYKIMVSVGLTVGGSVTLPKLNPKLVAIALPLIFPTVIIVLFTGA